MKAAIYGRVSPVGQAEPASSLTTQREKTQAAFQQRGWKLAGEYIDEGISRTKDRRPRQAMLAACRAAHVKAVFVAFCAGATGCQQRPLGIRAAFCSA
jgi:DNA invertase Pin-like site-specific DNA recombinase